MKIVWDEPKRQANIDKHGHDFADLTIDYFLDAKIAPAKAGRYKALGWLGNVAIIAVIFAPLGSEALSVISMRPASVKEKEFLK